MKQKIRYVGLDVDDTQQGKLIWLIPLTLVKDILDPKRLVCVSL